MDLSYGTDVDGSWGDLRSAESLLIMFVVAHAAVVVVASRSSTTPTWRRDSAPPPNTSWQRDHQVKISSAQRDRWKLTFWTRDERARCALPVPRWGETYKQLGHSSCVYKTTMDEITMFPPEG